MLIINPKNKLLLTQNALEDLKKEVVDKILQDEFQIDNSFEDGQPENAIQKQAIQTELTKLQNSINTTKTSLESNINAVKTDLETTEDNLQQGIENNSNTISTEVENIQTELNTIKDSIDSVDTLAVKTGEPAAAIQNLIIAGLVII